jgi:hypothetical protein
MLRKLPRALANPYSEHSFSHVMRARRMRWLLEEFPDLADMSVVDLGGDPRGWRSMPVRPARLVMLNLFLQEVPEDWVTSVVGDACDLPDELRKERFDLVFSNGVFHLVGGHWRRERFAHAVNQLSDRHWIQTPYRYFPMDPHWLFPGFQFFPVRIRTELSRRWTPARRTPAFEDALSTTLSVEMLSKTEMRHYFPESRIRMERLMGLPKSLIAVK